MLVFSRWVIVVADPPLDPLEPLVHPAASAMVAAASSAGDVRILENFIFAPVDGR
jgi:hypothetical protein